MTLALLPALAVAQTSTQGNTPAKPPLPVPPASAAAPDHGQWPMPAKNYASTRFANLKQIDSANVGKLEAAFTFSLGVDRGQEAAPIVVHDTMYIVTAFPNIVFALDLTKPGAPLKWEFQPHPAAASQGEACCDVVNRGGMYWHGKFIFNTLDGNTVALDAKTGKKLWETKVYHYNKGETITMAPLVVKGKVLVGDSGGEYGIHGSLTALDANSGKVVWKAYTTGPDKKVLIGHGFHPFYASAKGKNLGVSTWPPGAWKIGGGPVWGWISYDPKLNLIFYGTGNPGPWNPTQREGVNLWTSGIFARNPQTGAAVWFDQYTPHDLYDYDGINENILLDMTIHGRMRRVLVHPDRNGYLYILDRKTGQMLSAKPYGYINSSKGIDLKTGKFIPNPKKSTNKLGTVVHDICPAASGVKDWNPSAYSPKTGFLYIPHENLCMNWESVRVNYIQGTPYMGANVIMMPGPGGNRGELTAWNLLKGKPAWQIKEKFPLWSGALATAGNLVFYGTMDGWFKAVNARTGKLLWRFKTGSGIIGQPIAYRGPHGREYIAILSGVGGWAGAIVDGNLDPRDPTGALGFVGAMADLKKATQSGGMLYVFALPKS